MNMLSIYKLGGLHLKKYTFNISEETLEKLKQYSKKTRVPVSRYLEEAVEDLLRKYNIEVSLGEGIKEGK